MKKIMKKVGIMGMSLLMVAGASSTLTACGKDDDEKQVMSISVNPAIEFVVDEDDKVLSVTATNEDGMYLLEKYAEFEGMSAKDAALKVIELAEEYGFVVSGSANGEEVTISVSGDGAEKLYKDVKGKIADKVSDLGLTIGKMVELGEEELEKMVAECYQEYSATDIDEMDDEELLNLLEKSRKETKDLINPDERLAYYQERAQKVIEAKIDAIKAYVEENAGLASNLVIAPMMTMLDTLYAQVETSYNTLTTQMNELGNTVRSYKDEYIGKKREYLAAVEEYRTALEENATNVNELKSQMETLRAQAKEKQSTLSSQRENFKNQMLQSVKTSIHAQLNLINGKITEILGNLDLTMAQLDVEVQEQVNVLINKYKTNSVNPWEE